jgi:hypothetical protein
MYAPAYFNPYFLSDFNRDSNELNQIPEAPVLHPTIEEFKNFSEYLEKMEPQLGNAGIFKVCI